MIKKNGLWAIFSATLTPSIIVDINPKIWKIIAVNSSFENITGLKNTDIVGAKIRDIFKEAIPGEKNLYVDQLEASLKAAYTSQLSQNLPLLEVYIPFQNEPIRKWETVITPIAHIKHHLDAILISIIDVTETSDALENMNMPLDKLTNQQEAYKNIFNHHPDLLFILDTEGNIIEANKAFYSFFSTETGIFPNKTILKFVEESEKEFFLRSIHKCLRGEISTAKLHFRFTKYRQAILEIKLVPQFTEGKINSINGTMRNISSDTEQQHKLLQNSILSQSLSQISQILINEEDYQNQLYKTLEITGRALTVDRIALYQKEVLTPSRQLITDKKIEWLKDKTKSLAWHGKYRYYLDDVQTVKNALYSGKIFRAQINDLPKGKLKATLQEHNIMSLSIIPLFVAHKFFGMISLENYVDGKSYAMEEVNFLNNLRALITIAIEKHAIEVAKFENHKKFERLVQNTPGIVYRCLPDEYATMTFLNNKFSEITGFRSDDFIYNKTFCFIELIHPEDLKVFNDSLLSGPKYDQYLLRLRCADGKYKKVENRSMKMYNNEGHIEYLDGVMTELKYLTN